MGGPGNTNVYAFFVTWLMLLIANDEMLLRIMNLTASFAFSTAFSNTNLFVLSELGSLLLKSN